MAKLSPFAGNVLLAQGGGFEPQRKSNFCVIIPDLGDDETLVLSLKSAEPPPMAMVQQSIKGFNQSTHYAGAVAKFNNMPLQYHDYIDRQVLPTLSKWFKRVWNPETGGIGRASNYKKRGSLFLLPPGMEAGDAPGAVEAAAYKDRVWVLNGIWPLSLKQDQLDHDDEGTPALINLELSVDSCYPKSMVS